MALVNFVEDHCFMGYQSPNSGCIKILLLNHHSNSRGFKKKVVDLSSQNNLFENYFCLAPEEQVEFFNCFFQSTFRIIILIFWGLFWSYVSSTGTLGYKNRIISGTLNAKNVFLKQQWGSTWTFSTTIEDQRGFLGTMEDHNGLF